MVSCASHCNNVGGKKENKTPPTSREPLSKVQIGSLGAGFEGAPLELSRQNGLERLAHRLGATGLPQRAVHPNLARLAVAVQVEFESKL
jgi:hypothetical protein